MRSALTDTPVVLFTTQLLREAQHTTGLMVKVALLLPSRDLLSSQRQLRWTHTVVFATAGLVGRAIGSERLLIFSSGLTLIIKLLIISSTKYFQ
jgi:hypothetical protein